MYLEPISCISSTQDNMCTLVSCTDNTLKLMDKQKGELLNEYINFKFNYNEVKYLYKMYISDILVIQSMIILLKIMYFIMTAQ